MFATINLWEQVPYSAKRYWEQCKVWTVWWRTRTSHYEWKHIFGMVFFLHHAQGDVDHWITPAFSWLSRTFSSSPWNTLGGRWGSCQIGRASPVSIVCCTIEVLPKSSADLTKVFLCLAKSSRNIFCWFGDRVSQLLSYSSWSFSDHLSEEERGQGQQDWLGCMHMKSVKHALCTHTWHDKVGQLHSFPAQLTVQLHQLHVDMQWLYRLEVQCSQVKGSKVWLECQCCCGWNRWVNYWPPHWDERLQVQWLHTQSQVHDNQLHPLLPTRCMLGLSSYQQPVAHWWQMSGDECYSQ